MGKDVPAIYGDPYGADPHRIVDEHGREGRVLGVARYQLRDSLAANALPASIPLIEETEHNVIKHILGQQDLFPWFFEFMLEPALGARPRGRKIRALCGVRRMDVGLDPNEKPGDFDVVLLATSEAGYHLNEVMAIEVKILRSWRNKRDRHPRPSGSSQAKGLIRDGFPFAGMLHIILCEPSPKEDWSPLVRVRILNDNFETEQLAGTFPTDTVSVETTERHFGRMQRYVFGTSIGAKAIGVVLDETGTTIIGRDLFPTEINPIKNTSTNVEMLKQLCSIAASIERVASG